MAFNGLVISKRAISLSLLHIIVYNPVIKRDYSAIKSFNYYEKKNNINNQPCISSKMTHELITYIVCFPLMKIHASEELGCSLRIISLDNCA